MGAIYGRNIWAQYIGAIYGRNIWAQYMGAIYGRNIAAIYRRGSMITSLIWLASDNLYENRKYHTILKSVHGNLTPFMIVYHMYMIYIAIYI